MKIIINLSEDEKQKIITKYIQETIDGLESDTIYDEEDIIKKENEIEILQQTIRETKDKIVVLQKKLINWKEVLEFQHLFLCLFELLFLSYFLGFLLTTFFGTFPRKASSIAVISVWFSMPLTSKQQCFFNSPTISLIRSGLFVSTTNTIRSFLNGFQFTSGFPLCVSVTI